MQKICLPKSIIEAAFTVGIFLVFFGILAGAVRLWSSEGPILMPAGSWISGIGFLSIIGSLFFHHNDGFQKNNWFPSFSSSGLLISFFICFFSDWVSRSYSFPKAPEIRGEVFLLSIFTSIALWNEKEKIFFRSFLIGSTVLLL